MEIKFGTEDTEETVTTDLRDAIQTFDGGFMLAGSSTSGISGDKSQPNQGEGNDFWMVKTDANGMLQWDASFGGEDEDQLNSVVQCDDGGYILGGWSRSDISGDVTQPIRGLTDYWIVKTDDHGNKEWDARFGGDKSEYFYSLQQTTDGGFVAAGYSESGISFDKSQECQGGFDYWVVKNDRFRSLKNGMHVLEDRQTIS
jgi:hypothetical protein